MKIWDSVYLSIPKYFEVLKCWKLREKFALWIAHLSLIILIICYSGHGSESTAFNHYIPFNYLNTGLVCNSEPNCTRQIKRYLAKQLTLQCPVVWEWARRAGSTKLDCWPIFVPWSFGCADPDRSKLVLTNQPRPEGLHLVGHSGKNFKFRLWTSCGDLNYRLVWYPGISAWSWKLILLLFLPSENWSAILRKNSAYQPRSIVLAWSLNGINLILNVDHNTGLVL